jgi:hypothetical protein
MSAQSSEPPQSNTPAQAEAPKPPAQAQNDREGLQTTLSDIERRADIIVAGSIIDDGKERVSTPGAPLEYGFTVYSLEITSVYKGDVSAGDTVELRENHYSGDIPAYSEDNYLPSEKNKEYLFFLYQTAKDSPGAGAWFPVSAEYGRYPLFKAETAGEYSNDELGLNTGSDEYRSVLSEVLEKYAD